MARQYIIPTGNAFNDAQLGTEYILFSGNAIIEEAAAAPAVDVFFQNRVDEIRHGRGGITASQLGGVLVE